MRSTITSDRAQDPVRGVPLSAPPEIWQPVRTLFAACEKFKLGDRVKLRRFAFGAVSFKKYRGRRVFGTLVGFCLSPQMILVQLDNGQVEESHYNFWEKLR